MRAVILSLVFISFVYLVKAGPIPLHKYKIAIITDSDKKSKVPGENQWRSILRKGEIIYKPAEDQYTIEWNDDVVEYTSETNFYGRGMELSELVNYNGALYSVDDKTGVVYKITNTTFTEWVVLKSGDGNSSVPFKCEWATVKENKLYVGSHGYEKMSKKKISHELQFIKIINQNGEIEHIDWNENYNKIHDKMGMPFPGYVVHEAVLWSDIHNKWFFLPRKCTPEPYDAAKDEILSCATLISTDDQFNNIEMVNVDRKADENTHGYASMKFLPESEDSIIVALSTVELNDGTMESYFSILTKDGKALLDEQKVPHDDKYEGIEFVVFK